MPSFEDRLVRAVKRKREAQGLSIRALSAAVGVSFSTLARIERGEGQPDNNSKIRLLEWLGPDAEEADLSFDSVAYVHFRAAKNIKSSTVQALLRAAGCIRKDVSMGPEEQFSAAEAVPLSKEELESAAEGFRADLKLKSDQPLDSLKVKVDGVQVIRVSETDCLDSATAKHLCSEAVSEWSAMSVPLEEDNDQWAILLNDGHTPERQRVTLLEEYWHILLGHKLTRIARISEVYGRTYDQAEEHDAYYLASATLLPRRALMKAVKENRTSAEISQQFGTSAELVEYRIKRLGLWRDYIGKRIRLD